MTLGAWLQDHTQLPRIELEWLLCSKLGITTTQLITSPERPIEAGLLNQLNEATRRLDAGEPLAYILGERGFWDFTLTVSPAVLIPRPETETLVEQALEKIQPGDRVLDLGTGSGAIAIALARNTGVDLLAVDRSDAALAVAEKNAHRLDAQLKFRRSDWFDQVPEQFNVIVANPPYVAAADPHLETLTYEPAGALVSGPLGLDDLQVIISQAPGHLLDGGWLLVEHGYDQAETVSGLFQGAAFNAITLVRDLGSRPRVTLGQR